jgi:hypothetical protein
VVGAFKITPPPKIWQCEKPNLALDQIINAKKRHFGRSRNGQLIQPVRCAHFGASGCIPRSLAVSAIRSAFVSSTN